VSRRNLRPARADAGNGQYRVSSALRRIGLTEGTGRWVASLGRWWNQFMKLGRRRRQPKFGSFPPPPKLGR
jgi:hypothetical protein